MKSLSEITADNAAVEKRIEAKRKAALRRPKQRITRIYINDTPTYDRIYAAIDAWDAKERRRG